MSLKHNKKRNTGLLYEFLVRHVSERLVEGKDGQARQAIKLLRKHILKKDTELYREFRLFHALVNTTVKSESVAIQIVAEAREASKKYDLEKLDREKSLLIRSINHTFKNPSFFDKRFEEYKIYATVQRLFNEWRKDRPDDISLIAHFEQTIVEWLMTEKKKNVLDESIKPVDELAVKLMIKKVNSKYSEALNTEQINILKNYVYSVKNDDSAFLLESLEKLRNETLVAVDDYMKQQDSGSSFVIKKLNEMKKVLSEDIGTVDDKVLTHFLRIAKLKQEIAGDK